MSETQVNPTSNSQTSSPNPAPTPTVSPTSDSINQPSPTAPTPVAAPTSSPEPSPEPTPVAPAAAPTPTVAPTPEVSSAPEVMPGAGASVTNDPVQFNSSNIGIQTVKKHDPFAEQNRVAAEKKQASKKRNKIIIIVAGVVAVLAIVGGIIWLTITLSNKQPEVTAPEETPSEEEEIPETAEQIINRMNAIYANGNNEQAALAYMEEIAKLPTTTPEIMLQIQLAHMIFVFNRNDNAAAVNLAMQIDPDSLSVADKVAYYNIISQAYYNMGDIVNSDRYGEKAFDAKGELTGWADEEVENEEPAF